MSFQLKHDERLAKGIRRIVRKQLDKAFAELSGEQGSSRDEAVHEARKSLKKVRAVLRLVRPVIGKSRFRSENIGLRDAGRPLTEVRDAKILVDTLNDLAEHFKEHISIRSFAKIREALQANLRAVRKRVLDEENALMVSAAAIGKARKRIQDWTHVPDKWRAVGNGLEDVYRRANEAFQSAATDPIPEQLHEWRKQTKYLRYQLEILQPLWPERMDELIDETHRMTDLLGDDHDLLLLRQIVAHDEGPSGDETSREMLSALVDRRRAEFQQEAVRLGERFFQDDPRQFSQRLKAYWKTWRTKDDTLQVAERALA